MDKLPITRCKDGLARVSDDQYALSAIRFRGNKALERPFKLKIFDFFEQLGPGRGFPAGIARHFRATRSRKEVSGWNCSTFSSNSVQEGRFRRELLDFFEQLGSGRTFPVGVTRLFRATLPLAERLGTECSLAGCLPDRRDVCYCRTSRHLMSAIDGQRSRFFGHSRPASLQRAEMSRKADWRFVMMPGQAEGSTDSK